MDCRRLAPRLVRVIGSGLDIVRPRQTIVRVRNIRVVVKLVGGITWSVPVLTLRRLIRCTEIV